MDLTGRITDLRHRRGWTQEELAEFSGLSVRTIRNIELGRVRNPHRSSVDLLARALDVAGQTVLAGAGPGAVSWRGPQPPEGPLIGTGSLPEQLAETVRVNRLTTFYGPGGVGKTRLALAVAKDLSGSFLDRVAFVELGDLPAEKAQCPQKAAILRRARRRLGWSRPGPEQPDEDEAATLPRGAPQRAAGVLLILDNAEHVAAGVLAAARELLDRSPHLRILITARRPLTRRLGVNWEIRSLAVVTADGSPRGCAPATVLLLRHLGRDRLAATGLADDHRLLAELCRRLDGIPRYLEFAAERLRAVPIRLLLADGPTKEMLSSDDFALLPHQRSAVASIRWDLDSLTDGHARLLGCIPALRSARFTLHELMAQYGRCAPGGGAAPLALFAELLDRSFIVAADDEPSLFRAAPFVLEVIEQFPHLTRPRPAARTGRRPHGSGVRPRT